MKVIVATANTMEQWEDWSHTLGIFSSLDCFDKWVRENYIVGDIVHNDDMLVDEILYKKFPTYFIFDKDSVTDDSGDYYHVYLEDGEECKYMEFGEFVTLEEFEVIG